MSTLPPYTTAESERTVHDPVLTRDAADAPRHAVAPDRLTLLWRAKWFIVLAIIVVTGGVYGISKQVTPVYSSSSTVRLSATQSPGASASDVATASDTFAAQYAEVVTSSAVIDPAAASAGASPSDITSHISAGTVASQNLIQITAQSSNPATAQKWSNAVAQSLRSYVAAQAAAQAALLRTAINKELGPISAEISTLQARVSSDAAHVGNSASKLAVFEAEENQLNSLITSRTAIVSDNSTAPVSTTAQVLSTAGAPSQVSPRPVLYSIIAAIAALLVASELALVFGRRKYRSY